MKLDRSLEMLAQKMLPNFFVANTARRLLFALLLGSCSAYGQIPDFRDLVEIQAYSVVRIVSRNVEVNSNSSVRTKNSAINAAVARLRAATASEVLTPINSETIPKMVRERHGSGFLVSNDGYLLTHSDLVSEGDEIIATLHDKQQFTAKLVGMDAMNHVAVLKINGSNFPKVAIGHPERLRTGDWVVVLGTYPNASHLVTGIVTAKGDEVPNEIFGPFIQSNTAVNPRNYGAPMFNREGEVVGMTTPGTLPSINSGFNIAVPIDVAMSSATEIKNNGRVVWGVLNLTYLDIGMEIAERFGLPSPQGVLVATVTPGGAGAKAGIQRSDILLAFDGKPVLSPNQLLRLLRTTRSGANATVTVWRDRKKLDIPVVLGDM